ncbi:hypothetical protein C8F04DRAFT_1347434 [Mycena alexandri]|uniref:Uncharacterized protein n=1 Tax=Mycena alexandri TaxID=1745969 RepID=A0AAD6WL43_9AGAR|nr:hypothetical protein C8F04DRAFT_1347434 [Mycena alexandri]
MAKNTHGLRPSSISANEMHGWRKKHSQPEPRRAPGILKSVKPISLKIKHEDYLCPVESQRSNFLQSEKELVSAGFRKNSSSAQDFQRTRSVPEMKIEGSAQSARPRIKDGNSESRQSLIYRGRKGRRQIRYQIIGGRFGEELDLGSPNLGDGGEFCEGKTVSWAENWRMCWRPALARVNKETRQLRSAPKENRQWELDDDECAMQAGHATSQYGGAMKIGPLVHRGIRQYVREADRGQLIRSDAADMKIGFMRGATLQFASVTFAENTSQKRKSIQWRRTDLVRAGVGCMKISSNSFCFDGSDCCRCGKSIGIRVFRNRRKVQAFAIGSANSATHERSNGMGLGQKEDDNEQRTAEDSFTDRLITLQEIIGSSPDRAATGDQPSSNFEKQETTRRENSGKIDGVESREVGSSRTSANRRPKEAETKHVVNTNPFKTLPLSIHYLRNGPRVSGDAFVNELFYSLLALWVRTRPRNP